MVRSLRTRTAALALAVAATSGVLAGMGGHALRADEDPAPRAPQALPPDDSPLLDQDDVPAARDFAVVGWDDVEPALLGNGEPQFALSCQRSTLAETGIPDGVISASWTRGGVMSAAAIVGQATSAPQAAVLTRLLAQQHRHCSTDGRDGSRTPTTLLTSIRGSVGTAQVWRVGDPVDDVQYSVLVSRGDRVALIDLYSDRSAPVVEGLRSFAIGALRRL